MKNLPIVISFDAGASGRFVMSMFNYLLGHKLQPISTNGSAHNDDTVSRGAGNYVLFWENYIELVNNYIAAFSSNSEQWRVDTADIPLSKIPSNTARWHFHAMKTVTHHLNYGEFDPRMIDITAQFLKSEVSRYADVIRTHVVNRRRLRAIFSEAQLTPTIVHIYMSSVEDIIVSKTLKDSKNKGITDLDASIKDRISKMQNNVKLNKQIIAVQNTPKGQNEFLLPFKIILEKNIHIVVEFIKTVAAHCELPFTLMHELTLRAYIEEYFSMQPVLNYNKEDLLIASQ